VDLKGDEMGAEEIELKTWKTRACKREQIVHLIEKQIEVTTDIDELIALNARRREAVLLWQHALSEAQRCEAILEREAA
jgi:hypothetical protein